MKEGYNTMEEFLTELVRVCKDKDKIGVVLGKGNYYSSHQFNMNTEDLQISARLFREFVDIFVTEH